MSWVERVYSDQQERLGWIAAREYHTRKHLWDDAFGLTWEAAILAVEEPREPKAWLSTVFRRKMNYLLRRERAEARAFRRHAAGQGASTRDTYGLNRDDPHGARAEWRNYCNNEGATNHLMHIVKPRPKQGDPEWVPMSADEYLERNRVQARAAARLRRERKRWEEAA